MTVKLNWGESVLVATIDRPERRNAVDQQTLYELASALDESVTRKTRVVIITGTAPAFCSGADLSGVSETEFTDALHNFLIQLATLPSVTIAAIATASLGKLPTRKSNPAETTATPISISNMMLVN